MDSASAVKVEAPGSIVAPWWLVAVQFITPPIPMYLYGQVAHFPFNFSPVK